MRIVRRPHNIVQRVPVEQIYEYRVVDERRENLTLNIFARLECSLILCIPRAAYLSMRNRKKGIQVTSFSADTIFNRENFSSTPPITSEVRESSIWWIDRDDASHELDTPHIQVEYFARMTGRTFGATMGNWLSAL